MKREYISIQHNILSFFEDLQSVNLFIEYIVIDFFDHVLIHDPF